MRPKDAPIVTAQPTPRIERIKPRRNTSRSVTWPDEVGRFFVRPIFASMSRSHHMLSTVLPAMARKRLPASPSSVPMLKMGQRALM